MHISHDTSDSLIAAHSLFAALEARCLAADAGEALPYLGMARSEFTDHGLHRPARFEGSRFATFGEGMEQLDTHLTRLIVESSALEDTLRLTRARQILREGTRT